MLAIAPTAEQTDLSRRNASNLRPRNWWLREVTDKKNRAPLQPQRLSIVPDFVLLVSIFTPTAHADSSKKTLLCNHQQLNSLGDFGVQLYINVVLTNFAQSALRQANFRLIHFYTSSSDRVGNITGTD